MSWSSVIKEDVSSRATKLAAMEFERVGISFHEKNKADVTHIYGYVVRVVSLIGMETAELLMLLVSNDTYPEGKTFAIRISDIIGIDGSPK